MSLYVTKNSLERVATPAAALPSGAEDRCLRCSGRLQARYSWRSIWIVWPGGHRVEGGYGEVRRVGVVYCPSCDPRPDELDQGTPIYEDEIVEVRIPD